MFRKSVYVTLAVAAFLAVVLGWQKFSANVRAIREVARDQFDEMKGEAVRAAEIKALLDDFGKSINDYAAQSAGIEDRIHSEEEELASLRAESSQHLAILRQAKGMLEQDKPQFVIGDRTWTRTQVGEDAMRRAAEYKRIETKIRGREQALAQLHDGLADSRASLNKARASEAKLTDELAGLETRLENAQMLASVRQLTGSVRVPEFGPGTELAAAMDRLRQGVHRAEVVAEGSPADTHPRIDWSTESHEALNVVTKMIDGVKSDPAPSADVR